jgi:hypothetical protein
MSEQDGFAELYDEIGHEQRSHAPPPSRRDMTDRERGLQDLGRTEHRLNQCERWLEEQRWEARGPGEPEYEPPEAQPRGWDDGLRGTAYPGAGSSHGGRRRW